MIIKRSGLLLLMFYFPIIAWANIIVMPIVVDLDTKHPEAKIAVKNSDLKHKAYVEVISYRIPKPAHSLSNKFRVINPDRDGLLVFPAKLVLLPGQTQYVRLVKTTKNIKRDQVYEIDFIPKVASYLIGGHQDKTSTIGIKIIIGYGARVTIRPDHLEPSFLIKRINKKLMIKNTGNTSLKITSCVQTIDHQNKEIPLPAYTLHAGQTIYQNLKVALPVTLNVSLIGSPLNISHSQ